MSKVDRFSLEERDNYQIRKVIYDRDADSDIELNNIYPIIDQLNKLDKQIADLEDKLEEIQNQTAIEELRLVLDNFRNRPAYFDVARQELCLSEQDKQFIDFVNNRIKELGGVENVF